MILLPTIFSRKRSDAYDRSFERNLHAGCRRKCARDGLEVRGVDAGEIYRQAGEPAPHGGDDGGIRCDGQIGAQRPQGRWRLCGGNAQGHAPREGRGGKPLADHAGSGRGDCAARGGAGADRARAAVFLHCSPDPQPHAECAAFAHHPAAGADCFAGGIHGDRAGA